MSKNTVHSPGGPKYIYGKLNTAYQGTKAGGNADIPEISYSIEDYFSEDNDKFDVDGLPSFIYDSEEQREKMDKAGRDLFFANKNLKELEESDADSESIYQAKMKVKELSLDRIVAEEEYYDAERKISDQITSKGLEEEFSEENLFEAKEAENGLSDGISGGELLLAAGKIGRNGKIVDAYPNVIKWEVNNMVNNRIEEKPSEETDKWSHLLAEQYAKDNNSVVVHNSKYWSYDGLVAKPQAVVLDEYGNEKNLARFVNVSDGWKWKNGVPPELKTEILVDMEVTRLPYTTVVARIDGEIKTFKVNDGEEIVDGLYLDDLTPEARNTFSDIREKVAQKSVKDGSRGGYHSRGPISDNAYERNRAVNNMTALLYPMSKSDIESKIDEKISSGSTMDQAVREVIADNFNKNNISVMNGIDLETSSIVKNPMKDKRGFDPAFGDIIETGMVRHDMNGNEISRFSRIHGNHDKVNKHNGTGAEDIHHISPDDVKGKPRFNDPEENNLVKKELSEGDIMVAHNINFETNQLSFNIKDYDDKKPWLDTAWLTKHFSASDEGKGTLESFCNDHGVEYVDAHRAANDAEMMMRALHNFFQRDKWWER